MPTYNVTTWSELVNALKQAQPDDVDTVINLMNDIDMNEVAPTGVGTNQIKCFGRSMVLNGNGHYIKNLRTSISNPQPIFSMADYHYLASSSLNILNLDFVNLICAGADFLFDSSNYRQVNFRNCRFVGYRTGNSYLIHQNKKITCTSCYFDMPWYGAGSSAYEYTSLIERGTPTEDIPTANFCWFHESYGGWTLTGGSSTTSPPSDYPTTQCCMFAMNGCYIDGTMKVPYKQSGSDVYIYCHVYRNAIGSYYTASTPNVIDMEWTSTRHASWTPSAYIAHVLDMSAVFSRNVTYYGDVPIPPSSIAYSRDAAGSQPDVILATPEQMEDVSWLRAQGFPVIEDTPSE